MRNRVFNIAVAVGLVAAFASLPASFPQALVLASPRQEGYGYGGYRQSCPAYGPRYYDEHEVALIAYQNGYEAGYEHGYRHYQNRWGYDCRHDVYRDGLYNHQPSYGSSHYYRKHFRRGYKEGYRAGYYRSGHRSYGYGYFEHRRYD